MRGKRIPYNEIKDFTNHDNPIDFVKLLFDSISTNIHEMPSPEWGDIRAVTHFYLRIKDGKLKKKFALAIVSLMDDPDYGGNAIEAAANIPLIEAKEKFIQISKMTREDVEKFNYPGGNPKHFLLTYCSYFYNDFKQYLISLLEKYDDYPELITALGIVSRNEPEFILKDLEKYFLEVLKDENHFARALSVIEGVTGYICLKYGKDFCIQISKRIKENLDKRFNKYFYQALSQSPYFEPYLPEIKKILEIG